MGPKRELRSGAGAASVEHVALSLLIGLLAIIGIASVASRQPDGGRELGFSIARKLRCAAQGPGPCWRDPLTTAYGRDLAGAVRALAPPPRALASPQGPLLPVDFRNCRSAGCAAPGTRSGLTASNRRVTTFTSISSGDAGAGVLITYWEYRPGLGWTSRELAPTEDQLATLAPTPLLDVQVPTLVALETLPGANHFRFTAGEEPPWRWQIDRR